MAGTINSLGIGSGVLTSDLLDKLRESDESVIIKPLESKITLANQKEDAYDLLSTLMTTFKSSASALDGDNLYLSRAVTGNTDAVTVTAESGSNVQDFTITNVDKAEADVWHSSSLSEKSTPIVDLGSGTLTISINGEDFDIEYTDQSSLNEIRDGINETAGESVTASVLQVGEDSYELVLTAKETNQAITFADTNSDSDSLINTLSLSDPLNNIQQAKAATFEFNGIEIVRDTNEISDLIVGVTINLNKNQEATDSASISISQNSTSISSEISLFVSNYNSLITNLQDMTRSDRETGSVGIFNGDSFVKSISREITSLVTQMDENRDSLINYGIELDRDGVMSLNNDMFATQYATDPEGMELFFSGDSKTDGIFTKLNTKMNEYTGYNQLMSSFSDQLESAKDNLVAQYDKQKASLDTRYEILQKKFIAYDAIISRINAQFSSLQMMIDAEANRD
ncbi:MAG: flagellar filament capping protein FliD [Sulfurimonas sp.]|nr:flagellar filament capping protein FliD [Sulfurimonas sp.]